MTLPFIVKQVVFRQLPGERSWGKDREIHQLAHRGAQGVPFPPADLFLFSSCEHCRRRFRACSIRLETNCRVELQFLPERVIEKIGP